MTQGVFEVAGVHHNTMEEEKFWNTQHLQKAFPHIRSASSLKTAYGKEIDQNRVTDVEEISGNGVTAKVDGVSVAVGNAKLMKRIGVDGSRMSSGRNGHSCGNQRQLMQDIS